MGLNIYVMRFIKKRSYVCYCLLTNGFINKSVCFSVEFIGKKNIYIYCIYIYIQTVLTL